MQKNVIVFWDWNGTIVDDSFVFVDILNCLLKENSLPEISLKQYRESFCFPIDVFYKKINLYKNKSFFNPLNKRFATLYKEKMYLPGLDEIERMAADADGEDPATARVAKEKAKDEDAGPAFDAGAEPEAEDVEL